MSFSNKFNVYYSIQRQLPADASLVMNLRNKWHFKNYYFYLKKSKVIVVQFSKINESLMRLSAPSSAWSGSLAHIAVDNELRIPNLNSTFLVVCIEVNHTLTNPKISVGSNGVSVSQGSACTIFFGIRVPDRNFNTATEI